MRKLFAVFGRIRDQALSVRRRVLDRTDEAARGPPGRGLEDPGA